MYYVTPGLSQISSVKKRCALVSACSGGWIENYGCRNEVEAKPCRAHCGLWTWLGCHNHIRKSWGTNPQNMQGRGRRCCPSSSSSVVPLSM